MYTPSSGQSADEVIDELATLMTAGRLSPENRAIAKTIYTQTKPSEALRKTQQLIVSSAEYHSTGTVTKTGRGRQKSATASGKNKKVSKGYKATVFLMLSGDTTRGICWYHTSALAKMRRG